MFTQHSSDGSSGVNPLQPQARSIKNFERLLSSKTKTTDEKLHVVAQEFEQILFQQMFRSVQKSSFGHGFFAESGTNSQYSEMILKQLSDTMASNASLGIADSLHSQLLLAHDQATPSRMEE
jgi:Rod binding domain-containing protein